MNSGFEKILAVVDSSQASIHAAKEASELAVKFGSKLCLLHVIKQVSFVQSLFNKQTAIQYAELETLKNELKKRYDVAIQTFTARGKISEVISDLVAKERIDLIVVAGKKQSVVKELMFRTTAESITHAINCEVLCVYPETDFSRIKQVVIPVGKIIPKRKILIAYELAKKFSSNIHLISLAKDSTGLKTAELRALMDAYRYMKELTNIPIQCSSVIGSNIAEAAIRYAKKIKADLILVNPDTESKLKDSILAGWGRDIINHSPVPVLSVHSIK